METYERKLKLKYNQEVFFLFKTKFLLVGLLIFVMVFAISGCRAPQPAPSPAPGPDVPQNQTPDPNVPPQDPNWNQPGIPGDPMNPNMIPGPPTPAPGPQPAPSPVPAPAPGATRGRGNQAAERIANMVTEMENVERATAVVMGNMAIIGVRMEGGNGNNQRAQNRDNAAHQEMKQEIAQKVENEMPEISEAMVTADPQITQRIENISQNIAQGRPISESMEELAQIVRDMAPRRGAN